MIKNYCLQKCTTLGLIDTAVHATKLTKLRVISNEWDFALNQDTANSAMHSKVDHVAVWRASFMKLFAAQRHRRCLSLGQGDRIFPNAKFEMLCADAAHHTKYRLW